MLPEGLWVKDDDWVLNVTGWFFVSEILFHIRLAIMFLLLDHLKLYGIQMFMDETLGWEKPFTVENSDDIFAILQWKNNSLVIWVVKRECWMFIP